MPSKKCGECIILVSMHGASPNMFGAPLNKTQSLFAGFESLLKVDFTRVRLGLFVFLFVGGIRDDICSKHVPSQCLRWMLKNEPAQSAGQRPVGPFGRDYLTQEKC